jgi:hypothetical protein
MDAVNRTTGTTAESIRGALDAISSGNTFGTIGLDVLSLRDGLTELDHGFQGLPVEKSAVKFKAWGDELGLSKSQMSTLLDNMPTLEAAISAQLKATGGAADKQAVLNYLLSDAPSKTDAAAASTDTAADAYLNASDQANTLADAVSGLLDAINKANGVGQDAVSTNASYQAALAGITGEVEAQKKAYEDANGSLDGFNLSLDENTVSGSANAAMLSDVAGKAQDAALAQFEVDKTTMSAKDAADKYQGTLAAQRQAFIDSATQAGFNADEVQRLADKVFAMPTEREVKILADTASALVTLDDFMNRFGTLAGTINYRATLPDLNGDVSGNGQMGTNANGGFYAYAAGGFGAGIYSGGTPLYKFAEPETGWEAFISGKQSERGRNISIWQQAGDRLGVGGGGGGSYGAPAPIYVQNPFTGEYLLAQVAGVASGVAQDALTKTFTVRGRS